MSTEESAPDHTCVRRRARILIAAVTMLICGTAPAHAEWIAALVVGATGLFTAGGTGAAIATGVVELGLSFGCHVRSRALRAHK